MEINELWKAIKGFEGKYEVSSYGRVKSIGGKFRLAGPSFIGAIDAFGYPATTLRKDGKRLCIRVHSLVAEAFIPKPKTDEPLCVNHIDGNKANNHISNLEWTTSLGNSRHAVRTGLLNRKGEKHENSKLTDADVMEIRNLYKTHSQRFIAERFKVGRRHLSDIITGKCWLHLPVLEYPDRKRLVFEYERSNNRFTSEQIADMFTYQGRLPLNEIAQKFGCSPSYVCTIFSGKSSVGARYLASLTT